MFKIGNRDATVFAVGAFLIILAVDQSFDFSFGWWGILFWVGIGILYGNLCAKRNS